MSFKQPKTGDLVKVRASRFHMRSNKVKDSWYLGVIMDSNSVLKYRGLLRVYAFHTKTTVHVDRGDIEIV